MKFLLISLVVLLILLVIYFATYTIKIPVIADKKLPLKDRLKGVWVILFLLALGIIALISVIGFPH